MARLFDIPPPEAAQKTQISGTLPTYKKAKDILDKEIPEGKTLDFGAGLGLGAKELDAIDVEPWCYENTVENIKMNDCQHMQSSLLIK